MKDKDKGLIWEAYVSETTHSPENSCLDDEYYCTKEKKCKKKEDKDAHLESTGNDTQFKFDGKRPITSNSMYLSNGEIGYYVIGPGDIHYWVEAEIEWEGSHYKGAGPGSYWGPEPDEEPMIDDVNVISIRDEDDKEVTDETLFKAIQEWSFNQLGQQGWSDMEAMGWDAPGEDF